MERPSIIQFEIVYLAFCMSSGIVLSTCESHQRNQQMTKNDEKLPSMQGFNTMTDG